MITRIVIAVAVLFASPVWSASGGFDSGNDLFNRCVGSDALPAYCIGYTTGVADTLGSGPLYDFAACLPDRVSKGQIRDIVVKYLQDNPQERHYAAVGLTAKALSLAFPCR